jgi:hypothetical protein
MVTALAVQGFEPFADYLSAVADHINRHLEGLRANGRAYLELSDPYPGHLDIMFNPQGLLTWGFDCFPDGRSFAGQCLPAVDEGDGS